ncbi:hypothetical protein EI94DRAFT_1743862 [Lactarius quietus]|nr:hypothetical protein EI94DRAFT_1743862 [Lactarius quietus]
MALLFVTTWSLELVSIVPQVVSGLKFLLRCTIGNSFHLQPASSSARITSQGSKKLRSEGVPTSRDLDSQSTPPRPPQVRHIVCWSASCLGSMCWLSLSSCHVLPWRRGNSRREDPDNADCERVWPTTAADTVLRRPHTLSTVILSVVFVYHYFALRRFDYVAPGRGTEEAIRRLRINVAICIPVKD